MSAELSRMLRQLGEQPPPERALEQEQQRAEAIAGRLDEQLQSLVRQRRARLLRVVPLAAAAALLLGFAAWQLGQPAASRLAIEQEPLPPASPRAQPAPAQPEMRAQPAQSALPEPKPRPQLAGSSTQEPPPAPSVSAEPTSTLADENRLFKDAAEATRIGDSQSALRHLDTLLEAYPRSPLAQTALVRKLRLLAKSGQTEAAASAARRYLELYPTGFAANEAQELLRGGAQAAPAEAP